MYIYLIKESLIEQRAIEHYMEVSFEDRTLHGAKFRG